MTRSGTEREREGKPTIVHSTVIEDRRDKFWTEDEDKILEWGFGAVDIERLAKRLKRTEVSCFWRARKLGIDWQTKKGLSKADLCRMIGVRDQTLDRVIKRHGIQISRKKHVYRLPAKKKATLRKGSPMPTYTRWSITYSQAAEVVKAMMATPGIKPTIGHLKRLLTSLEMKREQR